MRRIMGSLLLAVTLSEPAGARGVRVVENGGVFWFEDANGARFFSLGVNCVAGCYGHHERRPLEPGRRARVVSSLTRWGFNTAACWSSPSVWNDLYVADQIYHGASPAGVDVFDPKFWRGFRAVVEEETRAFVGRRTFIGYFLDNEVKWNAGRIWRHYLGLPERAPGSRRLVKFLRIRYGNDPERLNEAWGTRFRGFPDLPESELPDPVAPALAADREAWRDLVAGTFYEKYAALVRRHDPDHLILGARWAGLPPLSLYAACSRHFDVDSVNDYDRYGSLNPAYARYHEVTGKPIMITEWSFSGWPEPGRKSLQFVDVYTQERRAAGYRKYVEEAAAAPFMIGMHWFLWMDYAPQDEAKGGYLPDENMGLVSHDESAEYTVLTAACAATNARVPRLHDAADLAPPPERTLPTVTARRLSPVIDGDLAEWAGSVRLVPVLADSLVDGAPFDHVYRVAWGAGELHVGAAISDSRIDFPGKDWAWEGDYLSVILSAVEEGEPSLFVHLVPAGLDPEGTAPYGHSWGAFADDAAIDVAVKPAEGGYHLEARIPTETLPGFGARPGSSWNLNLNYRNVNEIYETDWSGKIVLGE